MPCCRVLVFMFDPLNILFIRQREGERERRERERERVGETKTDAKTEIQRHRERHRQTNRKTQKGKEPKCVHASASVGDYACLLT